VVERFDPARLEILWSRLLSIADEMAITLTRTAFSSIVRDAYDYGCAIFDAKGNMIAMANNATPGLSVSSMVSVRNMLDAYGAETLGPGDVMITNNPWIATGHLLDLSIVTPVFYRDHLAGYTAAVAHHMDIGGRKTAPDSTEIYEEGLFLPVLKLYDQGQANSTLFRILESNVRVPEMVLGDLHAQVAANSKGAQRICELLEENGWSDLNLLGQEVLDRAERAMRLAISALPEGLYRGELVIDGFDQDLIIVATVSVKDGELTVDYTGTSKQVDRGINSVLLFTQGLTFVALKLLLDPTTPINSGCIRPLQIFAPQGTILAAHYPAPVVARTVVAQHLQSVLFMALCELGLDRFCAPSGGPVWVERFYGDQLADKSFFVLQLLNGGMGARSDRDGISALSFPGNVATIPTELFEAEVPLVVERKGLICDSGGIGRFRGGLGQEFRVMLLPDLEGPITLSIRADRTRNRAPGLSGGLPGGLARIIRNGCESLPAKQKVLMHPGDVISWQLPGGGGYGNPLDREPERVLADVINGLVSINSAQNDYGVILRKNSLCPEIDILSTNNLRKQQTHH
jgi:N-methylhydantoinase B